MPAIVRLSKKELSALIGQIEDSGGDATDLRGELGALEPEVKRAPPARGGSRLREEEETAIDRLNREVGDLFDNGVTDEIFSKLMDVDFNHSLKELKILCIEAGFSPSGQKKKLAAKLVAKGVL